MLFDVLQVNLQPIRPSLGSWLLYGLGSENENLPGYIVLRPSNQIVVGPALWSNSFLPSENQAAPLIICHGNHSLEFGNRERASSRLLALLGCFDKLARVVRDRFVLACRTEQHSQAFQIVIHGLRRERLCLVIAECDHLVAGNLGKLAAQGSMLCEKSPELRAPCGNLRISGCGPDGRSPGVPFPRAYVRRHITFF
jgi:hypothetical protein